MQRLCPGPGHDACRVTGRDAAKPLIARELTAESVRLDVCVPMDQNEPSIVDSGKFRYLRATAVVRRCARDVQKSHARFQKRNGGPVVADSF
jgi:hypothetical protein